MRTARIVVAAIVLAPLTVAAQTHDAPTASPRASAAEIRGEALMQALQSGGYTVVLRHARTDRSFVEEIGTMPALRTAQRNLSADGVRDAAIMGAVLRKYRVPFAEIVTSPMYRTRETAELSVGAPTSTTMTLRTFPVTPEACPLLAVAPRSGSNRLIVTHHFIIEQCVPGITPGAIGESEAAVVRPAHGGGVELVGRILLADWERLAGVPTTSPTSTPTVAPPANAAALHSAAAATHSATPSVALPETAAGRLAKGYIAAFNADDTTQVKAFIEGSLLVDPARPIATRMEAWKQSRQHLGGVLSPTRVVSETPSELVLGVRANGTDYILTVKVSPTDPTRAASVTISTNGHP